MSGEMMSGKEFPNNFEAIQEAPDEIFEPCSVEDFFDWRVGGWDIPSSVMCIMRAEHKDTGKITEHTYSKAGAARNRLLKNMKTGDYEVTIANHDSIQLIKSNGTDPITDELDD
jgi:hypothetical protein